MRTIGSSRPSSRGERVDARAIFYALSIMLYETLRRRRCVAKIADLRAVREITWRRRRYGSGGARTTQASLGARRRSAGVPRTRKPPRKSLAPSPLRCRCRYFVRRAAGSPTWWSSPSAPARRSDITRRRRDSATASSPTPIVAATCRGRGRSAASGLSLRHRRRRSGRCPHVVGPAARPISSRARYCSAVADPFTVDLRWADGVGADGLGSGRAQVPISSPP